MEYQNRYFIKIKKKIIVHFSVSDLTFEAANVNMESSNPYCFFSWYYVSVANIK